MFLNCRRHDHVNTQQYFVPISQVNLRMLPWTAMWNATSIWGEVIFYLAEGPNIDWEGCPGHLQTRLLKLLEIGYGNWSWHSVELAGIVGSQIHGQIVNVSLGWFWNVKPSMKKKAEFSVRSNFYQTPLLTVWNTKIHLLWYSKRQDVS